MTDPLHSGESTGSEPGGSTNGPPRWVKVFGIIVALVVLVFVILLLTKGPGGHGPGRHISGGLGASASTTTVTWVQPATDGSDDRSLFPWGH